MKYVNLYVKLSSSYIIFSDLYLYICVMKIVKLFDFNGSGIDIRVCVDACVCARPCFVPTSAHRRLFRLDYFQKQMEDGGEIVKITRPRKLKLALVFIVGCSSNINP